MNVAFCEPVSVVVGGELDHPDSIVLRMVAQLRPWVHCDLELLRTSTTSRLP